MATPQQAEQYRRNQAAIVAKAHEALERAWSRLDSDPKKARQEIVDLLTTLINYFGEMSSLHAVEYYDLMRELAASGKKVPAFRAEMLTSVAMEDVGPSAGWVANAVDEGNRGEALVRATAASQRLIQQWGRKTLIGNVKRDPAKPRFARVPYGKTCGFCRMLASRGAVYYTAESAGTLGQFHSKCDCQIVPSFNGELPYDPEPYYDEYLAAREEVGGDARKIAAKMDANQRRVFGENQEYMRRFPGPPQKPNPLAGYRTKRPASSPLADAQLSNGLGAGQPGRNVNCQRAVTAFELRRRGFDVTARPLDRDGESYGALHQLAGFWRQTDGEVRAFTEFADDGAEVRRAIESWPEGARGYVAVFQKNGLGHVFVAERASGVVRWVDPQRPSARPESYLSNPGQDFHVLRTDDLVPTGDFDLLVQER